MADLERRIHACENKCYSRTLGISYREHKRNDHIYDNKSVLSPDVRSFYCQPSRVASYHGSAKYVVVILIH